MLDHGRILSWSEDGTLRLWTADGVRLDVWVSPVRPIRNVILSKKTSGSGVLLVSMHIYILTIALSHFR